jgi:hypothetical protein
LYALLNYSIRATCTAHLILIDLMAYKLWSSSLCNLLQSPATSSLLGPTCRNINTGACDTSQIFYPGTPFPRGRSYGTPVTEPTFMLSIIQDSCVQFEVRSFIHTGLSFPVAHTRGG